MIINKINSHKRPHSFIEVLCKCDLFSPRNIMFNMYTMDATPHHIRRVANHVLGELYAYILYGKQLMSFDIIFQP